jgi:transposase-like protein
MTVTMTAPRIRVDPGSMPSPPDPEVPEKAKRRRFSADDKLAILREADACTEPGQIGALLRRERLYSSHLVDWRRQRETGALQDRRARPWRYPGLPGAGDLPGDAVPAVIALVSLRPALLAEAVQDLRVELIEDTGVGPFGEPAPAGRRRAAAKPPHPENTQVGRTGHHPECYSSHIA